MARLQHTFLVLSAFLCTLCLAQSRTPPPVYTAQGTTYYDVGKQIGNAAKKEILLRLSYPDILSVRNYVNSPAGRAAGNAYWRNVNATFPELLEELQGVSDGSGVSHADILMLNMLDEVQAALAQSVDHCTDVLTKSATPSWGHNEDGDVTDIPTVYYVNVTILDTRGNILEKFFAFSYPGTLGGTAYGYNYHGLVFSENAIFAKTPSLTPDAMPCQVLLRSAMRSKNIGQAIALLGVMPPGQAFNLNLANLATREMVGIECDPMGSLSVHRIRSAEESRQFPSNLSSIPTYFYHTNNFQVLSGRDSLPDTSSLHRMATLARYAVPNTTLDVRKMLGDTTDTDYPIYRNPGPPDYTVTITTMVLDVTLRQVSLYVGNPSEVQSFLTISL